MKNKESQKDYVAREMADRKKRCRSFYNHVKDNVKSYAIYHKIMGFQDE